MRPREDRLAQSCWVVYAQGNHSLKCDELTIPRAYSVLGALKLARGQTSAIGVSLPYV